MNEQWIMCPKCQTRNLNWGKCEKCGHVIVKDADEKCWPDTTPFYGTQTAEVWNDLAHKCTKITMCKIAERLKELNVKPMDVTQCAIIEASVFGVIIGAYHNVAEEAIKGENVSGALYAGDVADDLSQLKPKTVASPSNADIRRSGSTPEPQPKSKI